MAAALDASMFASPERPLKAAFKSSDPGPATPAAHHLIFAPRENNGGALPGDGLILSASELLPLPTTGRKRDSKISTGQVSLSLPCTNKHLQHYTALLAAPCLT
jgi:hypothetical protein